MTLTAKSITASKLLMLQSAAGANFELYNGELRPVLPASSRHGEITAQIAFLLQQFVKPRKLGMVLVGDGFILTRTPDTVLSPDVSLIQQSRIRASCFQEDFFNSHPDLAVEIISPSDIRRELEAKLEIYIAHGTPLGWLVNTSAQTVDIYRPNQPPQRLGKSDTITGEHVLPGFACKVAEFFD